MSVAVFAKLCRQAPELLTWPRVVKLLHTVDVSGQCFLAIIEAMSDVAEPAEDLGVEVEIIRESYDDANVQWTGRPEGGGILLFSAFPHTGSAGKHAQYVKADLEFDVVTPGYPESAPHVTVKRSSGLDQSQETKLLDALRQLAAELLGSPMLFSLAELANDTMTAFNTAGECVICLDDMSMGDITRSGCWHRFHTQCLGDTWRNFVDEEVERLKKMAAAGALGALRSGSGGGGAYDDCCSGKEAVVDAAASQRSLAALFERRSPSWRNVHLPCPVCREPLRAPDYPKLSPLLDEKTKSTSLHESAMKSNGNQPSTQKYLKHAGHRGGAAAADDTVPLDAILPGDNFEVRGLDFTDAGVTDQAYAAANDRRCGHARLIVASACLFFHFRFLVWAKAYPQSSRVFSSSSVGW